MATHIEDFAATLRELKERSGRSYGQLAARLHVSTSTLHRYCNGAAVPADYAPVERLARVCGATPEELVALHRRWLLADAQRREPGQQVGPVEAQPADGQSAESQSAEARSAEARSAEARSAEARSAEARSAEALPVEAQPADGQPVEIEPVEAEPVETEPVGAEGGRSGRRSRRNLLVLGAVAAVAAVASLPLALHGGRSGGDQAQNTSASSPLTTRSATGPATGTASARTSASASGSASASSSASPSASGSMTAPASPTVGADSGAGSGPPPFQVNVLADNWDTQCGEWFLMTQQPGRVPPPPSLEQTSAWASALGGIPAGHLRLQLTAQAGSTPDTQPIVLHTLYVHVVSAKAAPKGIAYTPGSGCGGGLEPASFAVDLDATVPHTKPIPGYVGQGTTSTLSDFPYKISATDPQVIDLDASTVGQDVSWYPVLAWSCGNRHGTLPVLDHGHPFRTVNLKGVPAYWYDGTKWELSTDPAD